MNLSSFKTLLTLAAVSFTFANCGSAGENSMNTASIGVDSDSMTTLDESSSSFFAALVDSSFFTNGDYVSALPAARFSDQKNAWGPIELDKSNGEAAANDGKTISLNGKTYVKGLGTHANFQSTISLNSEYGIFYAEVGIDDEVDSIKCDPQVSFRVLADGAEVFNSGAMTKASATKIVTVDVSGKNKLQLLSSIVSGPADCAHTDWANAFLKKVVQIPSGTLVSSLTPTLSNNGWGPVEKDRSNGEVAAKDGRMITLNGAIYGKGLGVHSPSEVRYNLDQKYARFQADIGIDDEVDSVANCNASAIFQVFADGTKIYESPVMNKQTATARIDVDVSGKNEMALVVSGTPDGNACDHADWANANLTMSAQTLVASYISDMNFASSANAWGPIERNKANGEIAAQDGAAISVYGKTFSKGLGVHAASSVVYALKSDDRRFQATIGIDNEIKSVYCAASASVIYQVFLDDVKAYESPVLKLSSTQTNIDLDISGKSRLKLVVTDAGDGNACDHADWADAKILSLSAHPIYVPVLPSAPSNLSVVSSDAAKMVIAWSDNSKDEDSFRVERKQGTGNFQEVAVLSPDVSSFTNTGLAASTTYSYRVRAMNVAGASTYSSEVQGKTADAPSTPTPSTPNPTPSPTGPIVRVSDYGAVANDGKDDSNAVRAAMNASKSGDVILFSGGVYNFSGEILLTPNRIYRGENGATLKGRGPNGQLLYINGDNITLTGLTIEDGGIFLDKSNGFNQNIVFDNNIFKTNTSGEHPSCITFTSGIQNSRITNNYFTGSSGFGIYGYNYNGLTIANNEFVNIGAGMHIDAFYNSGNLLVEQNLVSGARGMGFEFQSTATNLKFLDNYYVRPNLSTTFNNNNNSMAFSLILDKSSNIEIKRNVVLAPERPDGVGTRIGFELGGDNTIAEDNYINGVNHVAAMNDGVGTASVAFRNNRVANYLQSWSCSFCSGSTRTWTATNNGPNTQLTWDINRPQPARNKRY